ACVADAGAGEILRADPGGPGVTPIAVRGVYDVRIDYTADQNTNPKKAKVRDAVLARLQGSRNLCEDFRSVLTVEQQPFLVCAEIELAPDADADAVHAAVLRQVQTYLAPGVPRDPRGQMRAPRAPRGPAMAGARG